MDEIKKAPLLLSDFCRLGEELMPCSFEQGQGVPEIVEWILSHDSRAKSVKQAKDVPLEGYPSYNQGDLEKEVSSNKMRVSHKTEVRLLLAGKTNVGKSTLSNVLLRQERSLISPLPGTTLDVVEGRFTYGPRVYSLCDTAGFMGAGKNKMESLSILKTTQNFKTADLILLLLDGGHSPDRASARILDLCVQEHKPVIMVVNKWDKVDKQKIKEEYRKTVQQKWAFYLDLPVVFVSALKEKGLGVLMKKVEEVYQKSRFQISTSELNRFFTTVIRKAPSPVYGTQNVKFYYLTQTKQVPPSFIAFANYPEGVRGSYKRFIIKQIQKKWNLKGVPVRLSVLPRSPKKATDKKGLL